MKNFEFEKIYLFYEGSARKNGVQGDLQCLLFIIELFVKFWLLALFQNCLENDRISYLIVSLVKCNHFIKHGAEVAKEAQFQSVILELQVVQNDCSFT